MVRGQPLPAFTACGWLELPVQEGWPSLVVRHFATHEAYDRFDGELLTPHSARSYPAASPYLQFDVQPRGTPVLTYRSCRCAEADGSVWSIQRVGPITSRGGFDWHQMNGRDAFSLGSELEAHGSIYMLEHFMGTVSTNGTGIGYPPLHPHHIHLAPAESRLRYEYVGAAPANPLDFHRLLLVLDVHGDFMDCATPAACFTSMEPAGFARLVDVPLDLDLEVNDARAADSPALTWYLQLALRWAAEPVALATGLRPISQLTTLALSGDDHNPLRQSDLEGYLWMPTHEPLLHWYTLSMPMEGGELLDVRPHPMPRTPDWECDLVYARWRARRERGTAASVERQAMVHRCHRTRVTRAHSSGGSGSHGPVPERALVATYFCLRAPLRRGLFRLRVAGAAALPRHSDPARAALCQREWERPRDGRVAWVSLQLRSQSRASAPSRDHLCPH